jgi:hypothetical protein
MNGANVLIFIVCMSAAAGVLYTAGVTDMWGVNPNTDEMDSVAADTESQLSTFTAQTGQETWLTDVFIIRAAIDTISGAMGAVNQLPNMLVQLGLPEWVVGFLVSPLFLVIIFMIIYVATGRDVTR